MEFDGGKRMTKRDLLRQRVWLKYNRHCSYCGKEIEYKNMQVDHLVPKAYNGDDSFNNLMPSCRRCNHYKRAKNLGQFRILMKTLHERIKSQYIAKVAIDYGIIEVKPFNGIFYFEKVEEKE